MKDKPERGPQGPCAVGEHLVMNYAMSVIAERYKPGDPQRARLEEWAKENIPVLLKQGNESGDLLGAIRQREGALSVELSAKEAQRALVEKATGIEAHEKAVAAALAEGDVKRGLEEKVFFILRLEKFRDLQHPDIRKLMALALETGDQDLIRRLGRALDEPAIRGPDDFDIDGVCLVLTQWWVKGPGGAAGLCQCTDEALTEFCNLAFKRHDLTLDAVRKARQRLGLKKGPEPWFTKARRGKDDTIVLSLR